MILGNAFAAAHQAKNFTEKEQKRRRSTSRKRIKQGWFKQNKEPQPAGGSASSVVSHNTHTTISTRRSHPPSEVKFRAESRGRSRRRGSSGAIPYAAPSSPTSSPFPQYHEANQSLHANKGKPTKPAPRIVQQHTLYRHQQEQEGPVGGVFTDNASTISGFTQVTSTHMSIASALLESMENERLADVVLVGRDGVEIRAIKFVLASRTPGLQEVLYENPMNPKVFVGNYSGKTLRTMKDFCHTGEFEHLPLLQEKSADVVKTLVELTDFANRYSFEALYNESVNALLPLLVKSPWFSTAGFDSASTEASQSIQDYILQFIAVREKDHLLLETNACKYISTQRMPLFLQKLDVSDVHKIRILLRWLELQEQSEMTLTVAQNFVQQLSLEELLVDSSSINIVRESGFWDTQEIDDFILGRPSSSGHDTNSHDDSAQDCDEGDQQEEAPRSSLSTNTNTNDDNGVSHGGQRHQHPKEDSGDLPTVAVSSGGTSTKKKKKSRQKSAMEGICYQLTVTGDVVVCAVESSVADLAEKLEGSSNGSGTEAAAPAALP